MRVAGGWLGLRLSGLMMAHITCHIGSAHYRAGSSPERIADHPPATPLSCTIPPTDPHPFPLFYRFPPPSWRHEGPAARGGGAAPAAPRLGDATRRLRIGGAHLGHDHDRNGGAVIAPSLLQDAHGPVSCRNDLFKALN